MSMDVPSVISVSAVVTAAVGVLLVYSWRQTNVQALLWWGAADLLVAFGTASPLISGAFAEGDFIEVSNASVLLGYGMFYVGIRQFEGRAASLACAALGAVAWLIASQFPAFQSDQSLRAALSFLVSGSYVTASALLVVRRRIEPLVSRNAAVFLLCIHSLVLIGRVPEAVLTNWHPEHAVSRGQLFAAFALENLLFTVAMAFVLLAMAKERLEALQKDKAYTDLLTMAPNRRAFFEQGEFVLSKCRQDGVSSALILFDLDHFKGINDDHGHAAGDQTLIAFAQVAQSEVRAKDVFARIGGEEFGCLAPGLSLQEAVATAERVRAAMALTEVIGPSGTIRVTVSAGVLGSPESAMNLDDMLRGADKALYEAKRLGRNRIEFSRPDLVCVDGERVDQGVRTGSAVRAFRKRA